MGKISGGAIYEDGTVEQWEREAPGLTLAELEAFTEKLWAGTVTEDDARRLFGMPEEEDPRDAPSFGQPPSG